MTNYTVVIKKGDIEFSYSGGDRDFITSQIDLLFLKLKGGPLYDNSSSAKIDIEAKDEAKMEKQEKVNEETIKNTKQELQSQKAEKVDFKEKFEQLPQVENNEIVEQNTQEEVLFEQEADFVPSKLDNQEDVETENFEEKTNDEILGDLFNGSKSFEEKVFEKENIKKEDVPALNLFENILEEKMNEEPYLEETEEKAPRKYEDIIKNIKKDNLLDYLIITAYYLLENENMTSFQLKQLNGKLFASMKLMVDRKTVQKALTDGLLIVVSDGTEDGGIIEYSLSPAGREYYLNADI